MPEPRIMRPVEADIVAVSVGTDTRWSWRIISQAGELLQQSPGTLPSLDDARLDGRQHLHETRAQSPSADSPPSS
jgi:hypothetical protein